MTEAAPRGRETHVRRSGPDHGHAGGDPDDPSPIPAWLANSRSREMWPALRAA